VKALVLVAVALASDGGSWSVTRSKLRFQADDWSQARVTHRGTFPDGGRLEVWTRPGDRLVAQRPVAEWGFTIEQPDGGSRYYSAPAGTQLYQLDGGQVDFESDGGHAHCWHPSPLQHSAAYHRDEFCCHCAAERCVSLPWPDLCDGHGPRCSSPQLNLSRPRAQDGGQP
jgi:hypothetical protein